MTTKQKQEALLAAARETVKHHARFDDLTPEAAAALRDLRRAVAFMEPPLTTSARLAGWIEDVIVAVSELPDRTSPDDWPDAMLVTGEELRDILLNRVAELTDAVEAAAIEQLDGSRVSR